MCMTHLIRDIISFFHLSFPFPILHLCNSTRLRLTLHCILLHHHSTPYIYTLFRAYHIIIHNKLTSTSLLFFACHVFIHNNVQLNTLLRKMSNCTMELVFVPTPGMGHLLSTVEFAKRIIQRADTISVSIHIINFHAHASKISAYVDSQSRNNPYPTRLNFVTLPPLSNPPTPSSPTFFANLIDLHKPLVKQAVEDRTRAGFPKPSGFVLDMFCVNMVDVANDLNVPSYIFFTSGAGLLSLIYVAQSMADNEGIDVTARFSEPDFSMAVPGFKNPVTSKVIPAVFQDKDLGSEMLLNIGRRFRETKGILMNTYEELESYGLQALESTGDQKLPAVYPVGPILELDNKSRGSGSHDEEKESIMKWLDGQPEASVVFLCFGSMGSFDEEQIKEIAKGLDQSGHRFLWALRKPSQMGALNETETFVEALPEGFLDITAGRGKIIGWAPQVEVLAHPAVGGFVSHCGWNSTLESLWFGVPMATFPLYAEQQLNAFSLVKEFELAVEIRMDYKKDWKASKGNIVVTSEEVENGVKKLMSMDEKTRNRVKEMGNLGRKGLEIGGSSYNWLARFIEDASSNAA